MKIKQVRVYQSVPFHGRQETHFNANTEPGMGKIARKLDIMELDNGCVLVTDGEETIKIGMANVAVIIYENVSLQPVESKPELKKVKSVVKDL